MFRIEKSFTKTGLVMGVFMTLPFSTPNLQADEKAELAKQLANPVASLISVPVDYDYNSNIGHDDKGKQWMLTTKPVIPFNINEDWNLITRSIIAYVDLDPSVQGQSKQSGFSDLQMSFFVSPKKATNGVIWGVGPVLVFPTASKSLLGNKKYSAGPTVAALKQDGPWTYGMLAQHLWSYAGDHNYEDVSDTFLQPFISYTTATATNYTLQTEATYNWKTEQWSVPITFTVGQVLKIGSQLLQVRGGVRYWAESPDIGPQEWGLKAGVVFLFPR